MSENKNNMLRAPLVVPGSSSASAAFPPFPDLLGAWPPVLFLAVAAFALLATGELGAELVPALRFEPAETPLAPF